jgi:hypothetical protein
MKDVVLQGYRFSSWVGSEHEMLDLVASLAFIISACKKQPGRHANNWTIGAGTSDSLSR